MRLSLISLGLLASLHFLPLSAKADQLHEATYCEDGGSCLTLKEGTTLFLKLPHASKAHITVDDNPSTGYHWVLNAYLDHNALPTNTSKPMPGLVGVAGKATFVLDLDKIRAMLSNPNNHDKTYSISLVHVPPGASASNCIQKASYTIVYSVDS